MTRPIIGRGIQYDPETGIFTWLDGLKNQWAGGRAGSIYKNGYRYIEFDGERWRAGRLAWLLVTGQRPTKQIDHINGDKGDDRFINLREASNGENKRNSGLRVDNTSGYKCVSRRKDKWVAVVSLPWRKNQKKCGSFSNLIDAAVCVNYHLAYSCGEFAQLNSIPEGVWSHD
jgi:HNH endonuclease